MPKHKRKKAAYLSNPNIPDPEITLKRYRINGKTPGQKRYIRAINENKVVVCAGPAGTGKTHIAVASAILSLVRQDVEKIIIARPLVQAGEDTGFLPGDIKAKTDPYLRPVYDEMKVYVDGRTLFRLLHDESIEILPFAYMRGRTFRNTFIVADECQNAKRPQLKMLLTRLGDNSKMVLTGDSSQSDLSRKDSGGLTHVMRRLNNINNIECIKLGKKDIVRNPLVEQIIEALEERDDKETSQEGVSS